MKLSDFLIIYLACGAPFGVYYFLQHGKSASLKKVYVTSLALVFVWIPYAMRLLHDFVTNNFESKSAEKPVAAKLDRLQKEISQHLPSSDSRISIFEFREIFDRYVGLTRARWSGDKEPSKTDEEIFRVALREDAKLGARCLHRRNRARVERHQLAARKDFLQLISQINRLVDNAENLKELTTAFVAALNDAEAQNYLHEIFDQTAQSANEVFVQPVENKKWTTKKYTQQPAREITTRWQTLPAVRKD